MPTGPTYATFGNTVVSAGFTFPFGRGVTPSVCSITTVHHTDGLPSVADLTLKADNDTTIVFKDCLLEDPQLISSSRAGKIWKLPIKDRRWKWREYGAVYGHWNKQESNGSYTREKTPQQLIAMCLDELGEGSYDLTRVPNTARPEKNWDGNLPAAELDALCNELSCHVVLNYLANKVEIWPYGQGAQLPTGGTAGATYAPVVPAKPSSIMVEADKTLFQAFFDTEPVGLDTDGVWKHIDQLSYKPAQGWRADAAIGGFTSFSDSATYQQNGKTLLIRDLAASKIFRCYRVTGVNGWDKKVIPPLLAGTPMAPQSLKDLRLFDTLADEEISPIDGGLRPKEAEVFVRWDPSPSPHDLPRPDKPIRYPRGFAFDGTTGDANSQNIIEFDEPVFLWATGPAEVHLECSFFAGANGVYHRRGIQSVAGGLSFTKPLLIRRNELQAHVIYDFDNNGNAVGTRDNLVTVDASLAFYRDLQLTKYGELQGGTVNYPGLKPVAIDGLTEQITWSKQSKGATFTTVSQAQSHNRYVQQPNTIRDRLAAVRLEQSVNQTVAMLAGGK